MADLPVTSTPSQSAPVDSGQSSGVDNTVPAKTSNNYMPDGPIPGENYTSDTKNYPWHRAPEITDMDKAIEASIKQLTTKEGAYGLLNSLQAGVTVVQAADMFITSGIGMGKWTPDFGVILAGPVAKMMEIMAKDAGIKYAMGLDEDAEPTIEYFKKQADLKKKKEITSDIVKSASSALENSEDQINNPPTPEAKGFMSRTPDSTYKTPASMDTTKF